MALADLLPAVLWRDTAGKPLQCKEKIGLLHEALADVQQTAQDALDDAVLMGCKQEQVQQVLADMMLSLSSTVKERVQ